MNLKEIKRNFTADKPIIKIIVRRETDIEFEIRAVEAVNTINIPYVIKSVFFIFKKLSREQETKEARLNRTCARKRRKPRCLQLLYPIFFSSFRSWSRLK